MAKVERTEIFDIDREKLYQVIVDYPSYPQFVDGVDEIKVLEQTEAGAMVRYSLNMIKKFTYVVKLVHQRPNKVSWTFHEGDLFKKVDGSWLLEDAGPGKTKVTYSLDVDFKIMVPNMIANKLVSVNLPSMMKSYCDRAKKLK